MVGRTPEIESNHHQFTSSCLKAVVERRYVTKIALAPISVSRILLEAYHPDSTGEEQSPSQSE